MTVMSETVGKGKRVTVVTIGAKNICAALCRILCALCKCPDCCSVSQGLLNSTPEVLGTIQIMVGVINIGLVPGRTSTYPGDLVDLGAPYWLGAVYIIAGIMCILAGGYPYRCLVGFAVSMNIVGAIFAITGIALYGIDLNSVSRLWMYAWWNNYADCDKRLLTTMDILLIILASLQLCVNITFAVLGIKALINQQEREEGEQDVEYYKRTTEVLLKEVAATSHEA